LIADSLKINEDILNMVRLKTILKIEPISNPYSLDLSLPWDPIGHAADSMNLTRNLLMQENLQEKDLKKFWHSFSSIYSEKFESVLNKSGEYF